MNTVVLQSFRDTPRPRWIESCLDSARAWAGANGFAYRLEGDALFGRLPRWVMERTRERRVVATDLARLLWIRDVLAEPGTERAVWIDADVLVFEPAALRLPPHEEAAFAVGREVWVQSDGRDRLRSYRKVHNAFLMFDAVNPFLDYYIHAAHGILARHDGPMVPQLIGPKLLTALHNLSPLPVVEQAGMLSPPVARALLEGGGPALDLFLRDSPTIPAALNLCHSLAGSKAGETLSDEEMTLLCQVLSGGVLRRKATVGQPRPPAASFRPPRPGEGRA